MIPGGPFGQHYDRPERDDRWTRSAHVFVAGLTALLLPATQPVLNHDFPVPRAHRQPVYDYQQGATALTLPGARPVQNYDFPAPRGHRFPPQSYAESQSALTLPPGSPFIYAISAPIANTTIGVAALIGNKPVAVIVPSF